MKETPCFDDDFCPDCHGVGEVPDAHFYCDTCNGTGSVPARRYCFEVISPEMMTYRGGEIDPPEYGCCYTIVVAKNKREAIVLAVKHDDFSEWVSEARGDAVNPFSGLKAQLARCPHGGCWNCNYDEDVDSSGCAECDAEDAARQQQEADDYNAQMTEATA